MTAFDSNSLEECYRVGAAFLLAQAMGLLTDTNVAAADTVAGLRAAVAAAVMGIEGSEVIRTGTGRAITAGVDLGFLTDAAILGLTTVAGLVALSGIPSTYTARPFYD